MLADPISKGHSTPPPLGVGAQMTGLFCKFFGARRGLLQADLYLQECAARGRRPRLSDHFMLEAKWEQLTQSQDTQERTFSPLLSRRRYVLR